MRPEHIRSTARTAYQLALLPLAAQDAAWQEQLMVETNWKSEELTKGGHPTIREIREEIRSSGLL
jgi:hypothetical protein